MYVDWRKGHPPNQWYVWVDCVVDTFWSKNCMNITVNSASRVVMRKVRPLFEFKDRNNRSHTHTFAFCVFFLLPNAHKVPIHSFLRPNFFGFLHSPPLEIFQQRILWIHYHHIVTIEQHDDRIGVTGPRRIHCCRYELARNE